MKTKIFRFISISLSVLLTMQNVSFAGSFNAQDTPQTISHLPNIYIPESYGTIDKAVNLNQQLPKRQVIIVKDAHCNYEAQTNIAKILETLIRDYKIDLVCVEGAEGLVDTSIFGSYPDQKVREKVSEKYVKKGYLSASEALSIGKSKSLPFTIYGVEDSKLYLENFKEFRNTITNKKETGRFIEIVGNLANQLKNKIYNDKLLDFDKKAVEYNENRLSLTDWVKFLSGQFTVNSSQLTDSAEKKEFTLLIKAIKLEEGIDFRAVERERESLIKVLEKQLIREGLKGLIEKSLLFRLGKISTVDYYTYLEEYIHAYDLQLTTCNLRKYIHLVKLQSRIDSDGLFSEIEEIEYGIREGLYQDKVERDLDEIAKIISVLNKLYNLNLSRKGLEYYRNNKVKFIPSQILPFILIQAKAKNAAIPPELEDEDFLNKVTQFIQPAEYFYELALERDNVLANNLLEKMGKDNKNTAIMVVGGFHSNGIIQRLEEKAVSYTIITPKITKVQEDSPYMGIMMDKSIDIDRAISELGLNNLSPSLAMSRLGQSLHGWISTEVAKGTVEIGNMTIGELLEREGADKERIFALFRLAGIKVTETTSLRDLFTGENSVENLKSEIVNEADDLRASFLIEKLRAALLITGGGTNDQIEDIITGLTQERVTRIKASPDMRRESREVPHITENKWLEERHLNGETLFIKDGKVYEVVFEEPEKPKLDENGDYLLREVTDTNYSNLAQRWTRLWNILLKGGLLRKALIDNLLDNLGIGDKRDREYIKGEIGRKGLTLIIVKGRVGLGVLGDIYSHAGRRRVQITLGEYLLELMLRSDKDIQDVMFEELKHIIRDIYNLEKGLDRNTGQQHVDTMEEQVRGYGIFHNPAVVDMLRDAEGKAKIAKRDIGDAENNMEKIEKLIRERSASIVEYKYKFPQDMVDEMKSILKLILPEFYYLDSSMQDTIVCIMLLFTLGQYEYISEGRIYRQAISLHLDPFVGYISEQVRREIQSRGGLEYGEKRFWREILSEVTVRGTRIDSLSDSELELIVISIYSSNSQLKDLWEVIVPIDKNKLTEDLSRMAEEGLKKIESERFHSAISEIRPWFCAKFATDTGFHKKLFAGLGLKYDGRMIDALDKVNNKNCGVEELIKAIEYLLENFHLLSDAQKQALERLINALNRPLFQLGATLFTRPRNLAAENNLLKKLEMAKNPHHDVPPDMKSKAEPAGESLNAAGAEESPSGQSSTDIVTGGQIPIVNDLLGRFSWSQEFIEQLIFVSLSFGLGYLLNSFGIESGLYISALSSFIGFFFAHFIPSRRGNRLMPMHILAIALLNISIIFNIITWLAVDFYCLAIIALVISTPLHYLINLVLDKQVMYQKDDKTFHFNRNPHHIVRIIDAGDDEYGLIKEKGGILAELKEDAEIEYNLVIKITRERYLDMKSRKTLYGEIQTEIDVLEELVAMANNDITRARELIDSKNILGTTYVGEAREAIKSQAGYMRAEIRGMFFGMSLSLRYFLGISNLITLIVAFFLACSSIVQSNSLPQDRPVIADITTTYAGDTATDKPHGLKDDSGSVFWLRIGIYDIKNRLNYGDTAERLSASEKLAENGWMLKNLNEEEKMELLRVLYEVFDKETDPIIKGNIVKAFGNFHTVESWEILVKIVTICEDNNVRQIAMDILAAQIMEVVRYCESKFRIREKPAISPIEVGIILHIEDVKKGIISPRALILIYNNGEFRSSTRGYHYSKTFTLAQNIYENLKNNKMEIDDENIERVLIHMVGKMEAIKDETFIGPGVGFTVISSEDLNAGGKIVEFARKCGVKENDELGIDKDGILQMVHGAVKKSGEARQTIWFSAHASADTITVYINGANVNITYQELADSLLPDTEVKDLSKVVLVFDMCSSQLFAEKLYRELYSRGITNPKNLPIIIATSKGGGSFNSVFPDSLAEAVYNRKEVKFGDIFEARGFYNKNVAQFFTILYPYPFYPFNIGDDSYEGDALRYILIVKGDDSRTVFGARKNIIDNDYIFLPEQEQELQDLVSTRRKELVEKTINDKKMSYQLIRYTTDDEIGRFFKDKNVAGAFNWKAPNTNITYIFIEAEGDREFTEEETIALEHEELEIYWRKRLQEGRLPEQFARSSIDRVAHILAWGQQIAELGWKTAADSTFIMRQLERIKDSKELLDGIIKEDRSLHKELREHYLSKLFTPQQLAQVTKFENSIRQLAENMIALLPEKNISPISNPGVQLSPISITSHIGETITIMTNTGEMVSGTVGRDSDQYYIRLERDGRRIGSYAMRDIISAALGSTQIPVPQWLVQQNVLRGRGLIDTYRMEVLPNHNPINAEDIFPVSAQTLPEPHGGIIVGDSSALSGAAIYMPDGRVIFLQDEEGRYLAEGTVKKVATDENGTIYVATSDGIIRQYSSNGELIGRYEVNLDEYATRRQVPRESIRVNIQGMVVYKNRLYYTIMATGELRVLDLLTMEERSFGGPEQFGRFLETRSMGLNINRNTGIIYVVDQGLTNFESIGLPGRLLRIRIFDTNTEEFIKSEEIPGIYSCGGIAFDSIGRVYITDGDRNIIHIYDPQEGYIGYFHSPNGKRPTSIDIDERDNVIIGRQGGIDVISREAIEEMLIRDFRRREGGYILTIPNRLLPDGLDNVSCGTICQNGHEGSYDALDEQLSRQFDMLRRVYNENVPLKVKMEIQKNLPIKMRDEIPEVGEGRFLTEVEADLALVYLGYLSWPEFEMLQELRGQIRNTEEYKKYGKGIEIFFSKPETGTQLFWYGNDYAAGHFNREKTRIHISLPLAIRDAHELVLSGDRQIPQDYRFLSLEVARHELIHIGEDRHDKSLDLIMGEIARDDSARLRINAPSVERIILQDGSIIEISQVSPVNQPIRNMDRLHAITQEGGWHSAAVSIENLPRDLLNMFRTIEIADDLGGKVSVFDMLKMCTDEIIFAPHIMHYSQNGGKQVYSVGNLILSPAELRDERLRSGKRVLIVGTLIPSDAIKTGEEIYFRNIYEMSHYIVRALGQKIIQQLVADGKIARIYLEDNRHFNRMAWALERRFLLTLSDYLLRNYPGDRVIESLVCSDLRGQFLREAEKNIEILNNELGVRPNNYYDIPSDIFNQLISPAGPNKQYLSETALEVSNILSQEFGLVVEAGKVERALKEALTSGAKLSLLDILQQTEGVIEMEKIILIGDRLSQLESLNRLLGGNAIQKSGQMVLSILREIVREVGGIVGEEEDPEQEFRRILKEELGIVDAESKSMFELIKQMLYVLEYDPVLGKTKVDTNFYNLIDKIAGIAGASDNALFQAIGRGTLRYQLGKNLEKLDGKQREEITMCLNDLLTGKGPIEEIVKKVDKKTERYLRAKGIWGEFENLVRLMDNLEKRKVEAEDNLDSPFFDLVKQLEFYIALKNKNLAEIKEESPQLYNYRAVQNVVQNTDFSDAPVAVSDINRAGRERVSRFSEANALREYFEGFRGGVNPSTPHAISIPYQTVFPELDRIAEIIQTTGNAQVVLGYFAGLRAATNANPNIRVVLQTPAKYKDLVQRFIQLTGLEGKVFVGNEIRYAAEIGAEQKNIQGMKEEFGFEKALEAGNIVFFTLEIGLDTTGITGEMQRNEIKVFAIDKGDPKSLLAALILGSVAGTNNVFDGNGLSESVGNVLKNLDPKNIGKILEQIRQGNNFFIKVMITTAELLRGYELRHIIVDVAA